MTEYLKSESIRSNSRDSEDRKPLTPIKEENEEVSCSYKEDDRKVSEDQEDPMPVLEL